MGQICATKANESIKLCLNPRDLNKVILCPHFMTITFEDIISRLHGTKWFTIVDGKSGYWQMKLDKKFKQLVTFVTPLGRYMFNRFPMGVKSAKDEFQCAILENF